MNELWRRIAGLSLVHGVVPGVLISCALAGMLVLGMQRRSRSWFRRALPLAVLSALALLAAVWTALEVVKPFPDALPWNVLAWVGAALLGISLAAAGWRRQPWRRRAVAGLALLAVVLGAADQVNRVYAPYPTVAAALQLAPHDEVPASYVLGAPAAVAAAPSPVATGLPLESHWRRPPGLPASGAVTKVTVPAERSGFAARPAWVYVPPAYLTPIRPRLPVLVLLGGQPGGSRDWVDAGGLARTMDAFAAAHSGLAPVVVMPDALGAATANPMCMDSRLGAADTYLAVDVPAWIERTLQVDPDHAHWSVAGFSYGGTCAVQLAVAHPDLFPTFLDISGQLHPTLGDPARTVAAAFGGDRAAFDAADPIHELAGRRLPGTRALMTVGSQDGHYKAEAAQVCAALTSAGADVTYSEIPGGHSWQVATRALVQALPTIAQRGGVTG